MSEVVGGNAKEISPSSSPSPSSFTKEEKAAAAAAWPSQLQSYISELDLPRTFQQSTDSAIRSARSIQHSSSTHLRSFQDILPQLGSQYKTYEDTFFQKIKDEITVAKEHPVMAGGVAVTVGLLLMRGPRKLLFRKTIGRFQSEEAQFVRAEKNVKELNLSVDVMKNESRKLLERAALAERDMKRGQSDLMSAGAHFRSLAKSIHRAEAEAAGLMDFLREIPGREALKLRADVASMASHLLQQRTLLDKKIMKISELGVSV